MQKILAGFIMDGKSGGIDTYLLHFLDAALEADVQVDFLTDRIDPDLKEQLKQNHSRLFEIASLWHPVRQFRQVKYLIQHEGYTMVYLNISTSMDCIAAFAAFQCKVPRRLLHSHSGGNDCESPVKRTIFNALQVICRKFLYKTANEFYACSKKAGYWMYPKKIVDSDSFHVIYNAVDEERFCYHPHIRQEVRSELNVNSNFVVGHVGNFCYQKNHQFLLEIFCEILKQEPDAVLILIGKGLRFQQIQEKAKQMGIANSVQFLGWQKDADRLFQAMDVFLLPSHFEGLPTVGIEAQCTKLPCVLSDSITDETSISSRCTFLSLKESPKKWADTVLACKDIDRSKTNLTDEAAKYGLAAQKEQLKELLHYGRNLWKKY